jgi:hypothetical protein
MAVVLGPELDGFLRGIGDDLKGKTKVNYVDQDTLIRACSAQNKVILLLQEQILRMQETERGIQRTLNVLGERVNYFEKYTKKVDDIEDVMMEKIPLVDKMNEVVKCHDVTIERHETNFKEHVNEFDIFRDDTKSRILRNTQETAKLRSQLNLLPKTIIISSSQVTHCVDDEGTNKPAPDGKELLVDVISQQEQHSYLQDENTKKLSEKVNEHIDNQETLNSRIDHEMRDLVEWKVEQSSVDLVEMKENQGDMRNTLENHDKLICTKMSMHDVNKKLDLQFEDIVEHLQSALASVEKDEGDFRSITDTLSVMCKTLRENKADKSEINALRKQFIENQIQIEDGFGGIPSGGSTLDNEGLRKILMDYPTKAMIKKIMHSKADKRKVMPKISKIHSSLQSIEGIIRKLATSSSSSDVLAGTEEQDVAKFSASSFLDLDETTSLNDFEDEEDLEGGEEMLDPDFGSNQDSIPKERDDSLSEKESLRQDHRTSPSQQRTNTRSTTLRRHKGKKRKKPRGEQPFPSSNMLNGLLSDVPPNEEALKQYQKNKRIIDTGEYLKARPIRPSSAPDQEHELPLKQQQQHRLAKKNSLPAILTSISKSIRPRSKTNSKHKSKKKLQKNIHNGSFQVVAMPPRISDFDDSSSNLTDLPSVKETAGRSTSSEHRISQQDVMIRTSIA